MSGPRQLVDWRLAERFALAVGGAGDGARAPHRDDPFGQAAIEEACEEAGAAVAAYSRLAPARPDVAVVAVGRREWIRTALGSLREVAERAEPRLADALGLPGPLGGLARPLLRSAAGVEAGIAVGYASHRVLGQYDLSLFAADRPPRILFVSPNLASAQARLGESQALFLRWIALHEIAHAVQFDSVGWLRAHLARLATELLDGALEGLTPGDLRRAARSLLRTDPREVIRTLLSGDLVRVLSGPEQRARLDALQAAMTLVEGHAEHVMDAAGAELDPGYARLRERLEAHRSSLRRHALDQILVRLLGLDLKLRQYTLGKGFCDAVVASDGVDGLNRAWAAPEALPALAELERPEDWLERSRELVTA